MMIKADISITDWYRFFLKEKVKYYVCEREKKVWLVRISGSIDLVICNVRDFILKYGVDRR